MFNFFKTINKKSNQKLSLPEKFFYEESDSEYFSYYDFSKYGYTRNPIVFRCIQEIANGAYSTPLKLQNKQGEVITQHPLLSLLNRPNMGQSGSDFLETLVSYYLISGDAYVLVSKDKPYEIYPLRPDKVKVVPGKNFSPLAYEYAANDKRYVFPVDIVTGQSRIMHWKTFNPNNEFIGLSPLKAASLSIQLHNKGSVWNKSLLENSCRPSGALVSEGELSEEQFARLKEQLIEHYTGPKATGKTFVLEGGLKWTDMSISPKDMDFLNSMQNSAREIAFVLGVPPMLIGIPGDNTYNNQKEARIALWEQTIIPIMNNLCDCINNWIIPWIAPRGEVKLSVDLDRISMLSDKRFRYWNTLLKCVQGNVLTVNEVRQSLGYSPLKSDSK